MSFPRRGNDGSPRGSANAGRMPLKRYAVRCDERRGVLAAALERVLAVCRDEPEVREAFVFGSFAMGRIGPTSDLDVLVVRETTLGAVDRVADLALALRAPAAVDLIVVTPSELASTFAASSFGRTVLGQARRIYAA